MAAPWIVARRASARRPRRRWSQPEQAQGRADAEPGQVCAECDHLASEGLGVGGVVQALVDEALVGEVEQGFDLLQPIQEANKLGAFFAGFFEKFDGDLLVHTLFLCVDTLDHSDE